MNKLHEFELHIDLYKPDIIAITETWCPPILPEGCPAVEGYHAPFRQDRVSSHGGGVILFVKDNLDVTTCELTDSSFTESTWCKIKLRHNDILLVGVIYRSPTVTEGNNLELLKLLDRTKSQRYTHLLFMGDFNLTICDVKDKLLLLKENCTPGPDDIHPKVLKKCANALSLPLWLIMNKSLQESVVPDDWRLSYITPIHKKGSREEASNYRPMSLTFMSHRSCLN